MKTAVRESSLRAHDAIKADGTQQSQAGRVLEYVCSNPRSSRRDISVATGIRLASVCGRVKSLLELNMLKELELDKVDPESGKRVNTLQFNEA